MQLNETISVDHTECEDNKSRLFYTRVKRHVIFYCHNCGHKGRMTHGKFRRLGITGRVRGTTSVDKDKWVYNPHYWAAEAYQWVSQYEITDEEIREYKLAWDTDQNRVILPYYRGTTLLGYQMRSILPGVKPKYISKRIVKDPCYFSTDSAFEKIILTEDMLSAIKCGRYGTGIALMGTHMNMRLLADLIKRKPKQVTVFLDNDNREVCRAQVKLKSSIESVLDLSVTIVRSNKDPKEHTHTELEELLC